MMSRYRVSETKGGASQPYPPGNAARPALLVLPALLAGLLLLPLVAAYEDSRTLRYDEYHGYDISGLGDEDSYISFQLLFDEHKQGDLYVLNATEYDKYLNGQDFSALKEFERRTQVNNSFSQERQRQKHYLVVDNRDNAHPNDARPSSELSYSLTYTVEDEKQGGTLWILPVIFFGLFCLGPLVVVAILYKTGRGLARFRARRRGDLPFPDQGQGPPLTEPAAQGPPAHRGYQGPRGEVTPYPGSSPPARAAYRPPATPGGAPLEGPAPGAAIEDTSSYRTQPQTNDEPLLDMMLRCGGCQAPLEPDWKVCPHCETPVKPPPRRPTSCPGCGRSVKPDWKACPSCTSPLPDLPPGASRPTSCPGCQAPGGTGLEGLSPLPPHLPLTPMS